MLDDRKGFILGVLVEAYIETAQAVGSGRLASSSAVAPYNIGGEVAGSIGVLGSTRMDYPQVLATVGVVGRRLGDPFTEG